MAVDASLAGARPRAPTGLWAVLAVLPLIVPLTAMDRYLGVGWTGILPLRANAIAALCIGSACAMTLAGLLMSRRSAFFVAVFTENWRVLVPLLAFTFWCTIATTFPGAYWEEGSSYVIFPLFNLLVFFLALGAASSPDSTGLFRNLFAAALVLFCATVIVDFLVPGTFSTFSNRAADFIENANQSSRFIAVLLICALGFQTMALRDGVLIALATVTVFLTFSRSGYVMFAVILLCYFALQWLRGDGYRRIKVAFLGFLLLLGLAALLPWLLVEAMKVDVFRNILTQRLAFFLSVFGGEVSTVVQESRVQLIPLYLGLIEQAPIFGHGTGFSRFQEAPAHNIYLKLWAEYGIVGLGLYLWWLASLFTAFLRRGAYSGLLLVGYLLMAGVFSHSLNVVPFWAAVPALLLARSAFDVRTPARAMRPG